MVILVLYLCLIVIVVLYTYDHKPNTYMDRTFHSRLVAPPDTPVIHPSVLYKNGYTLVDQHLKVKYVATSRIVHLQRHCIFNDVYMLTFENKVKCIILIVQDNAQVLETGDLFLLPFSSKYTHCSIIPSTQYVNGLQMSLCHYAQIISVKHFEESRLLYSELPSSIVEHNDMYILMYSGKFLKAISFQNDSTIYLDLNSQSLSGYTNIYNAGDSMLISGVMSHVYEVVYENKQLKLFTKHILPFTPLHIKTYQNMVLLQSHFEIICFTGTGKYLYKYSERILDVNYEREDIHLLLENNIILASKHILSSKNKLCY